ncbi:uncharacterized protein TNCV_3081591 [Trichonephila clavipes]|nr:uncharacterized protein TNCV_3081591 [Trichonephila clavipes]
MAFLEKGSKVDLQYMATEMGVENVLGMRVFELRDAILNSEYFDEEFCREFLNTIIEERKRKEEIELDERKRKEKEIAERKRCADFEQRMRDVEMEFETQNKLIELEGEGHFTRACLDIEVSTDRGHIGNEVEVKDRLKVEVEDRLKVEVEDRLKVEVEDRLKADEEAIAVEEGRKMEEGRMNERIALEGEMRLKKERWLVEEQMRHIQEKRKTSMKEEQKCLPEERSQSVVEIEKEEISVDVIKDKDDLNPVILSKERIDVDEDEVEEEKPKLPKRKRKNLSRRTVAELQQKVNLKASSNMVLIPQHWSFSGEYSQDKIEMRNLRGN